MIIKEISLTLGEATKNLGLTVTNRLFEMRPVQYAAMFTIAGLEIFGRSERATVANSGRFSSVLARTAGRVVDRAIGVVDRNGGRED